MEEPEKKPKKRSRTSNASKRRYNSRVYSKYSFLVPKGGGLDLYIRAPRDCSAGELVRRALIEYAAKHPAKRPAEKGGEAP